MQAITIASAASGMIAGKVFQRCVIDSLHELTKQAISTTQTLMKQSNDSNEKSISSNEYPVNHILDARNCEVHDNWKFRTTNTLRLVNSTMQDYCQLVADSDPNHAQRRHEQEIVQVSEDNSWQVFQTEYFRVQEIVRSGACNEKGQVQCQSPICASRHLHEAIHQMTMTAQVLQQLVRKHRLQKREFVNSWNPFEPDNSLETEKVILSQQLILERNLKQFMNAIPWARWCADLRQVHLETQVKSHESSEYTLSLTDNLVDSELMDETQTEQF